MVKSWADRSWFDDSLNVWEVERLSNVLRLDRVKPAKLSKLPNSSQLIGQTDMF